jgi:hypothetical protein
MLNDWRDDQIQFGKQSKDDSGQLLALDVKWRNVGRNKGIEFSILSFNY